MKKLSLGAGNLKCLVATLGAVTLLSLSGAWAETTSASHEDKPAATSSAADTADISFQIDAKGNLLVLSEGTVVATVTPEQLAKGDSVSIPGVSKPITLTLVNNSLSVDIGGHTTNIPKADIGVQDGSGSKPASAPVVITVTGSHVDVYTAGKTDVTGTNVAVNLTDSPSLLAGMTDHGADHGDHGDHGNQKQDDKPQGRNDNTGDKPPTQGIKIPTTPGSTSPSGSFTESTTNNKTP